jgi:peptidylprolyl isomerase
MRCTLRLCLTVLAGALLAGCGDTGPAAEKSKAGSGKADPPLVPLDPEKTKTLPGDLKYEDLTVGDGAEAKTGDTVDVHYTGWLKDGKKFDSSLDRNRTFRIVLGAGQVIKGWDQGLVGMKEGGKRKLQIPPELAYGPRSVGGVIPPNATLVFDVELVRVLPGVKIDDLKVGDGPTAKRGDVVTVHYTGTLTNGKQFDSSVGKQPFTFQLGARQVIAGWDLGVTGMKVGGKRKLTIPPEMAYGEAGQEPVIPPNATLVFEIELLKIGGR